MQMFPHAEQFLMIKALSRLVIGGFSFFIIIILCLYVAHFSNMFPRQHSTFIGSVQPHYAKWHSVMCQTHVIIELCMQPSHVYPPTHLILCVWGAIYSRVWAVIIRNMPAEFLPLHVIPSPACLGSGLLC